LLYGVGVVECFDCVIVSPSGHQEVPSVNMNDWVLLVRDDQLLEIVESQVIVSEEVSTLASEDVRLQEGFVQLQGDRQVL